MSTNHVPDQGPRAFHGRDWPVRSATVDLSRSLAAANRLAPPGRLAQAISTYFVAAYCGLVIPVIGVGLASGFIGDFPAGLAFSILIAALCLVSLAGIRRAL